MQRKIFLIIFSYLLSFVLAVNIPLFLMTQFFFNQQTFFWILFHCIVGLCIVALFSAVLARFLSQILLKPFQIINFENLENFPYPELRTLIEKIKSQNKAVKTQFKYLKKKRRNCSL